MPLLGGKCFIGNVATDVEGWQSALNAHDPGPAAALLPAIPDAPQSQWLIHGLAVRNILS